MPIQARIRIGIKTIPIHMRILPLTLHMLENREEKWLLFKVMPIYNVFLSQKWQRCID